MVDLIPGCAAGGGNTGTLQSIDGEITILSGTVENTAPAFISISLTDV